MAGSYWHLVSRAQEAAKHLTMHGAGPTTKDYPDQNAASAKIDKL